MATRFLPLAAFASLLAVIASCTDETALVTSAPATGDEAELTSAEQDFKPARPATAVTSTAAWLTPCRDEAGCYVRLEQNGGDASRTALVHITYADGTTDNLTLTQSATPATRAERAELLRSHGVGYGYYGFEAEKNSPDYLTSQVFNLARMQTKYPELASELYDEDLQPELVYPAASATNFARYLHQTLLQGSFNADLVVFAADISKKSNLVETAVKRAMYMHGAARYRLARKQLRTANLAAYAQQYPDLLTASFREALDKIKSAPGGGAMLLQVDSLLTRFGTHIVTDATTGGTVDYDLKITRNYFIQQAEEELFSKTVIKGLLGTLTEQEMQTHYTFNDDEYSLDLHVRGGDMNLINRSILSTDFLKGERVSDAPFRSWIASIHSTGIDRNDELINMDILPLYRVIPDRDVQRLVRARMEGNVKDLAQVLGNGFFSNTAFRLDNPAVRSRIGGTYVTTEHPDMVNIISEDRIAATIAREWVPEISRDERVCVAYPVEMRRPDFSDGLCLHGGRAYRVRWCYNAFVTEDLGPAAGDSIYLNNGVLEPQRNPTLSYYPAHPVLYAEWPGAVTTAGAITGQPYPAMKFLGRVYIDRATRYNNLPGWSYADGADDLKNYPDFAAGAALYPALLLPDRSGENHFKQRMTMNPDYEYYYNPREITY